MKSQDFLLVNNKTTMKQKLLYNRKTYLQFLEELPYKQKQPQTKLYVGRLINLSRSPVKI